MKALQVLRLGFLLTIATIPLSSHGNLVGLAIGGALIAFPPEAHASAAFADGFTSPTDVYYGDATASADATARILFATKSVGKITWDRPLTITGPAGQKVLVTVTGTLGGSLAAIAGGPAEANADSWMDLEVGGHKVFGFHDSAIGVGAFLSTKAIIDTKTISFNRYVGDIIQNKGRDEALAFAVGIIGSGSAAATSTMKYTISVTTALPENGMTFVLLSAGIAPMFFFRKRQ